MLTKPVRWYDVDEQIIFPKWGVTAISTSGLAYIVDINEVDEKFFALGVLLNPIWDWSKIIDLVVEEWKNNKESYELSWSTLDGGNFPEPVKMRWNTELEVPEIVRPEVYNVT